MSIPSIPVQPAGPFWRWLFARAGLPLPCAFAVGIGRWKRIVTSEDFANLRLRERQAILAHEEGHHRLKHVRSRLLMLLQGGLFQPKRTSRRFQEQELEADLYAARRGHAWGLQTFLLKQRCTPDVAERIQQLRKYV